jgi:nucleoside-diphosphate-sugar epimerase
MARVLVTGATGCLGASLVRALLAGGHQVLAQGRDASAGAQLQSLGAHFLRIDLRAPLPAPALRGVTTVYHCAALSSAWGRAEDFEAINVTATRRLLQASQASGVEQFVFASSPSIYANGQDRLNLSEDAALPAHFATDYARSKYQAEVLVLAADQPRGMRCGALRPRALYGRGDRSLMPRLIAAIRRGRVPLINGGQSLIDITHVDDAARAMILAAATPEAGGMAFNITSGQAWRFTELLDKVCSLGGYKPRRVPLSYGTAMTIATVLELGHKLIAPAREPVLTRQAVASLGRSLTLNIERAREVLGYCPAIGIEQGIRDYADQF